MTYEHALNTYGTDAPDLRYGMTFSDVTEHFKGSGYKIFNSIIDAGGAIKGFALPDWPMNSVKTCFKMTWPAKPYKPVVVRA